MYNAYEFAEGNKKMKKPSVSGRRKGERRSGSDTRPIEEQTQMGERRSSTDRRSGSDRRARNQK